MKKRYCLYIQHHYQFKNKIVLKYIQHDILHFILKNLPTDKTYLRLEHLKLGSIPNTVKTYTKLETLILSNNQLKELPQWIDSLKHLQIIGLSNNPISSILEMVHQLPRLKCIYCSNTLIPTEERKRLRALNIEIKDQGSTQTSPKHSFTAKGSSYIVSKKRHI